MHELPLGLEGHDAEAILWIGHGPALLAMCEATLTFEEFTRAAACTYENGYQQACIDILDAMAAAARKSA